MHVQRVEPGAEDPLFNATLQDVFKGLHDRVVHGLDAFRTLDVFTLVDIFDADDAHKIRVHVVVIEGELHQPPNRLHRLKLIQIQATFDAADFAVELLQHLDVELLLAGEVVIDHALGGFGALGNRVHPRPRQALFDELDNGFLQDVFPRLLGVVLAAFTRFDCRCRGAGVDFWSLGHLRLTARLKCWRLWGALPHEGSRPTTLPDAPRHCATWPSPPTAPQRSLRRSRHSRFCAAAARRKTALQRLRCTHETARRLAHRGHTRH